MVSSIISKKQFNDGQATSISVAHIHPDVFTPPIQEIPPETVSAKTYEGPHTHIDYSTAPDRNFNNHDFTYADLGLSQKGHANYQFTHQSGIRQLRLGADDTQFSHGNFHQNMNGSSSPRSPRYRDDKHHYNNPQLSPLTAHSQRTGFMDKSELQLSHLTGSTVQRKSKYTSTFGATAENQNTSHTYHNSSNKVYMPTNSYENEAKKKHSDLLANVAVSSRSSMYIFNYYSDYTVCKDIHMRRESTQISWNRTTNQLLGCLNNSGIFLFQKAKRAISWVPFLSNSFIPSSPGTSIEWIGCSNTLACGFADGSINLYTLRESELFRLSTTFSKEKSRNNSIRDLHSRYPNLIHHDNELLVANTEGKVAVYDLRNNQNRSFSMLVFSKGPIVSARWSCHDSNLFACTAHSGFSVCDIRKDDKPVLQYKTTFACGSVRWRPGYRNQLSTCSTLLDPNIQVWDLNQMIRPAYCFKGDLHDIRAFDWLNQDHLIACDVAGYISVHSVDLATRPLDEMRVTSISWSPLATEFMCTALNPHKASDTSNLHNTNSQYALPAHTQEVGKSSIEKDYSEKKLSRVFLRDIGLKEDPNKQVSSPDWNNSRTQVISTRLDSVLSLSTNKNMLLADIYTNMIHYSHQWKGSDISTPISLFSYPLDSLNPSNLPINSSGLYNTSHTTPTTSTVPNMNLESHTHMKTLTHTPYPNNSLYESQGYNDLIYITVFSCLPVKPESMNDVLKSFQMCIMRQFTIEYILFKIAKMLYIDSLQEEENEDVKQNYKLYVSYWAYYLKQLNDEELCEFLFKPIPLKLFKKQFIYIFKPHLNYFCNSKTSMGNLNSEELSSYLSYYFTSNEHTSDISSKMEVTSTIQFGDIPFEKHEVFRLFAFLNFITSNMKKYNIWMLLSQIYYSQPGTHGEGWIRSVMNTTSTDTPEEINDFSLLKSESLINRCKKRLQTHWPAQLLDHYLNLNDIHMSLSIAFNLLDNEAWNAWKPQILRWSHAYGALLKSLKLHVEMIYFLNRSPFDELLLSGRVNMVNLKVKNYTDRKLKESQSNFYNNPFYQLEPSQNTKSYTPKIGNDNLPYCSVCGRVVRGLYVSCPVCLHGGHPTHLKRWFANNKKQQCPAGCGHICTFQVGSP